MTRTALIALAVITLLSVGIPHVHASDKAAADITITELDARIEVLEAAALPPPQGGMFRPMGELLVTDAWVGKHHPRRPESNHPLTGQATSNHAVR